MSEINQQEFDELTDRYRKLIASQKTLLLSTASTDGVPNISYAPFVRDDIGLYYIYVSELASHTVDLLNNPKASIMFIRPESESHNLFARERAVLNCSVKEIMRDTEAYTQRIQALQEKFGKVVSVLCALPDFHLFVLHQESGRYVAGFGQAFTIDVDNDSLKR
jgi:putative heme iron utilization protein